MKKPRTSRGKVASDQWPVARKAKGTGNRGQGSAKKFPVTGQLPKLPSASSPLSTGHWPLATAPSASPSVLFERVVGILEQARAGVVRAVNSHMVLAYWLIGREIVQEIQGGKERADYGRQSLEDLSQKVTARYGEGFSKTSLKYFRTFYLAYADRSTQKGRTTGDLFAAPPAPTEKGRTPCDLLEAVEVSATIPRHVGVESVPTPPVATKPAIRHPAGDEFHPSGGSPAIQHPLGAEFITLTKSYPAGSESLSGFSPQLSWSHYRALMRVEKVEAREFYEREATDGTWDVRTLERQIHSFYYERLLKSQQPQKMLASGRQTLTSQEPAIESLKNPYVLEFLGLPEVAVLHETDLEAAILSRLQAFLLELGKGFAFVARQKRLRFGDDDRYVDLVFYHCRLKFYLLIDLKIGELTHGDVGQMDGYVRMFDDLCVGEGDNPTIGLILCTEKNEAVAKYSVLKDRKQIFASKYMLYLPTEKELSQEIARERRLIEDRWEAANRKSKRRKEV